MRRASPWISPASPRSVVTHGRRKPSPRPARSERFDARAQAEQVEARHDPVHISSFPEKLRSIRRQFSDKRSQVRVGNRAPERAGRASRRSGHEEWIGILAKRLGSRYVPGRRTCGWIKVEVPGYAPDRAERFEPAQRRTRRPACQARECAQVDARRRTAAHASRGHRVRLA